VIPARKDLLEFRENEARRALPESRARRVRKAHKVFKARREIWARKVRRARKVHRVLQGSVVPLDSRVRPDRTARRAKRVIPV